jgi:hypothetical protein
MITVSTGASQIVAILLFAFNVDEHVVHVILYPVITLPENTALVLAHDEQSGPQLQITCTFVVALHLEQIADVFALALCINFSSSDIWCCVF